MFKKYLWHVSKLFLVRFRDVLGMMFADVCKCVGNVLPICCYNLLARMVPMGPFGVIPKPFRMEGHSEWKAISIDGLGRGDPHCGGGSTWSLLARRWIALRKMESYPVSA